MDDIKCIVHKQHFVYPDDTDFESVYIMSEDGAGMIRLTPDMDDWHEIPNDVLLSDFFVVESKRCERIGTTLLHKAEEVYAGKNKTFWLKLNKHNPLSFLHDWYTRNGYTDDYEDDRFIYMTKHID